MSFENCGQKLLKYLKSGNTTMPTYGPICTKTLGQILTPMSVQSAGYKNDVRVKFSCN